MAHTTRHTTGSEIHASLNYVWNTTSYLGRGATAVVYKGVHKATGEPAAIKTFTTDGFHRPLDAQMKELEILQKLDHENVVKLLAIEEEVQSRNKVVIMELCSGGSLYHILDDPENAFGLEEKEFLLVLEHLTAGMKYLRGNIISHRDLKPGNVVKFVTHDGRNIYKLTDFGAARTIEDDEQFTSLCGTEEYLNPDIYDKAVMKLPETKTFKPNVDLWSMGATIYHVATGSLPFRPYRGRDNRNGMHFMIRNKAAGVISAIQHENGDIEWNKELPKSCLVSQGLRVLITPLIASLLESRQERVWSFNKFFAEVAEILSSKPIFVFDVQHCKELTLYCQPIQTLLDFQSDIATHTSIPISDQFIIANGCLLNDPKMELTLLPKTDCNNRIFVMNRSSTEITLEDSSTAHKKFPVFDFNNSNLDHDAFKAKNFTNLSYVVKRNVERLVRGHNCATRVPHLFTSIVENDIRRLNDIVNQTLHTASDLDYILKLLAEQCSTLHRILNILGHESKHAKKLSSLIEDKQQERDSFAQILSVLHKRSVSINKKYIKDKELEKQWESRSGAANDLDRCVEMSTTYIGEIRDAWKQLTKYRELRRLSFHEEQFHQLEKTKLKRSGEKLLLLFQRCNSTVRQSVRDLDSWYSGAHVALIQSECLANELKQATQATERYQTSLKNAQIESKSIANKIVESLKEGGGSSGLQLVAPTSVESGDSHRNGTLDSQKRNNPDEMKKGSATILKELQDLKLAQSDLWNIIQENNSVIDKFQMLSSNLNSGPNTEDHHSN